jgi:3-methyl-2-oxobutanoate hydroxymethyltransferase
MYSGDKGHADRVTTTKLRAMKGRGERITMVTAYDYTYARIVDAAGVDVILVGDSLGQVVLGHGSTVPVTMDDMVHHTRAVSRGAERALVVGDMPFLSYNVSVEDALRNAGRLMQDGGARAVKLEGGEVGETVERMVAAGIPVMGHLGLTPQSINVFGRHRVQGKTREAASRMLEDARRLEEAGIFALVLETVPTALATLISRKLSIPTLGIGAGVGCDGQVQVITDVLGLTPGYTPKHARRYAEGADLFTSAMQQYIEDVRKGAFPEEEHSFEMDEAELEGLE